MLIPCEKHQRVHDLNPQAMADLISFYQSQWVAASYTPDAIPAGGSMSSEDRAYRSICPLDDAVSIAKAIEAESHTKATAHVLNMRRLREKFKKSR